MSDIAIRKTNADFSMYFDPAKFDHCQRVATMLSKSNIVPEHFQNNVANCFIALQMATRMGMEPLAFMQKSFVLKGKPGIEAQIGIAALNNSGLIKGRVSYELSGEGQNRKCTASVVDAGTGERFEFSITVAQATSVGAAASNPNWKALPDLMLRYRSATYLIRTHYPDVLMGLSTKDELEDMVDVTPARRAEEVRPAALEPVIDTAFKPEETEKVPAAAPAEDLFPGDPEFYLVLSDTERLSVPRELSLVDLANRLQNMKPDEIEQFKAYNESVLPEFLGWANGQHPKLTGTIKNYLG